MNDNLYSTQGAYDFAANIERKPVEVESNWWQFFSDYRMKCWKDELDELVDETGLSLLDVCRYLGVTYAKGIGFYDRLPKKRSMYIGIGMAFKQPLETINQWIVRYGMKRKLYVKELEEDLPWMHLICANYQDRKTDHNYYKDFDMCRSVAHEAYLQSWEAEIEGEQVTVQIETDLMNVKYDPLFEGLKMFVQSNMDSFKTAYVKPRIMLDKYVKSYISAGRTSDKEDAVVSLNSMRGYLDDSMINYLSGSTDTVNVIDLKSGKRTLKFKHVPKSKKAHVSLALALGMSRMEIDQYLIMMGFSRLDAVNIDEGILLNMLSIWESEHPLQKGLVLYDESDKCNHLSSDDKQRAIEERMNLRRDLNEMYNSVGRVFPYLKG